MSKHRRSVSLDEEVDEYLDNEGVNASELVNRLVRNYVSSGGNERAMLELRADQLRSDINELEGRKRTKEKELAKIERQLDSHQSHRENVIQNFVETLTEVDLEPDNPAVQHHAGKAEMPVGDFIQEVQERRPDDSDTT